MSVRIPLRLSSYAAGEAVEVFSSGRWTPGYVLTAQDTLVTVQLKRGEAEAIAGTWAGSARPIAAVRIPDHIRLPHAAVTSRTTIPIPMDVRRPIEGSA
jgi:hypothetical protein